MCTRPYRNDRIINVIRDMFFAGGAASFARRFRYLFPTYEARHREETLEVPIVMVALVATAVSSFFGSFVLCSQPMSAVCDTLRVAPWRSASRRVLGKCIPGRVSGARQHTETHSGESQWCIPSHDGGHLCSSKVSFNLIKGTLVLISLTQHRI
jgi:hypothetical protein